MGLVVKKIIEASCDKMITIVGSEKKYHSLFAIGIVTHVAHS